MYGGSLYDLAAEEGLDERILGELDGVTALLNGDAEYLHLLSIPSIPKKERCALLDEAFRGQVHLYVLNFMKLLCEKGALRELPGCARAYRLRYNEAHGILEATAVSAVPLTAEQTGRLHEKLEKLTGKTIDLKTKVDPAVLGGIRLDIEQAVRKLPEELREVAILSFFQELKQREIAELLQIKLSLVKYRIGRAKELLIKELEVEE